MQQFLAGRLAALAEHEGTTFVEFYNVRPLAGHVAFDPLWGSSDPESYARFIRPVTNELHERYVRTSAQAMGFDVLGRDEQVEPYLEAVLKIIAAYGCELDERSYQRGQQHLSQFSLRDPYRSLDDYCCEDVSHRLQSAWNLYNAGVSSRVDVLARFIGESTRWPMQTQKDADDYAMLVMQITGVPASGLGEAVYSMRLDQRWGESAALDKSLRRVRQRVLSLLHQV